jgi:hypothetical protein
MPPIQIRFRLRQFLRTLNFYPNTSYTTQTRTARNFGGMHEQVTTLAPAFSTSAMSSNQPERKKALLPGFGRPLNYIPVHTAPDYVGELFKSALSSKEIKSEARGVAYVGLAIALATGDDIALTSSH